MEVLAVLQALPKILDLLAKVGPEVKQLSIHLWTYLRHVSGNDLQGFLNQINQTMSKLNAAETHKERQDAAQDITKLFRKL